MVSKNTRTNTLSDHGAYAGSQGAVYVDTYLPDAEGNGIDPCVIAEAINGGQLIACPNCHFLHPAHGIGWNDRTGTNQHTGTNSDPAILCDICAYLPYIKPRLFELQPDKETLYEADQTLQDLRHQRAESLFDLWRSSLACAEALCWAQMKEALDTIMQTAAAPGLTVAPNAAVPTEDASPETVEDALHSEDAATAL